MSLQTLPSTSDRSLTPQATSSHRLTRITGPVRLARRHRASRHLGPQSGLTQRLLSRQKTLHSPSRILAVQALDPDARTDDSPTSATKEQNTFTPVPSKAEIKSTENDTSSSGSNAKLVASLAALGGIVLLIAGGYLLKDQITAFLNLFITLVDDWGPLGYVAYIVVYAALELLAVPAIPLTMTAGVIFGVGAGTAVVSIAATMAATGAFLIARYIARDKVAALANKNPKWAAIDRAIGKDGFRVVALLRLSPLLPLAASNYLYGLTSVDLGAYVLASWLGMLPGTFAYVAAGTYGRELMLGGAMASGGHGALVQPWQVALGVGVSGLAVWYVGRLATNALSDLEKDL